MIFWTLASVVAIACADMFGVERRALKTRVRNEMVGELFCLEILFLWKFRKGRTKGRRVFIW